MACGVLDGPYVRIGGVVSSEAGGGGVHISSSSDRVMRKEQMISQSVGGLVFVFILT